VRIHWAVVIFAVIGTILLTWHFRTKDMDFLKPSGIALAPEDDGSDLAVGPIVLQPKIEDKPEVAGVLGNPEEPEEPVIAEISDLDLGDLEASPGLDSYRDFGKKNTPDRLFQLSSTLRARGQFQRALIAFERVLDSTKAGPEALAEAAKGISALSPTLPRWNIDPTSEVSLTLNIGSTRPASDSLKGAALELATLIRKSSSDQLEIIPKISNNRKKDAPDDSPIAIWLGTGGQDPASTSVVTLTPSEDETLALDEISLALFQSVRSHLAKLGYPLPPPVRATGSELISTYITRLMWQDFALSLKKQQEADPETTSDQN
jgi:hypothetical protein